MGVPASVQLAIFAKVWKFDRTFTARAKVRMLVLYQRRNRESLNAKHEISAAAASFSGVVVREADLEKAALSPAMLENVDVVYVAPLRSVALSELLAITRAAGIPTVTGVAEYVAQGVAVGIALEQNRPSLVINLPASRLEGSDFSSQLLKLAKVIQ